MSENQYKSKGGIARIYKAFLYSAKGLAATIKHEAAFRQELIVAIFLIPIGLFLGDTATEKTLLAGSVIMVLIIEIINSAIESIADAISTETRPLLGRAKDQGSAAVLLSIVLVVFTWAIILVNNYFWQLWNSQKNLTKPGKSRTLY